MIPNTIHFIFGLRKDFGSKPFSFFNYLAVKSAYDCNHPNEIKFYYKYKPKGKWWEKSKKYLTLIKVEPPTEIFGNKLIHYAHQSDILRYQILMKEGGIYLDMDVICLNSFKPILKYDCVMGKEGNYGLCNAVMLVKAKSRFLKKIYDTYHDFKSGEWGKHSVVLPLKLANLYPDYIHVEDRCSFFWPLYNNPAPLWKIRSAKVSEKNKYRDKLEEIILSQSYCMHLWNKLWWDPFLKNLSPESIKRGNTLFAKLCLRFLDSSK